ncbi:hypothetical protein BS78_02G156100 [Paspalum vaginatum]|nr:hypothetical protein BS78_02G156100 [Paspalum vaginatum]
MMMPSLWLFCLLLSTLYLPNSTSFSFSFDFTKPGGYNAANFSFDGDAYYHPESQVIELTKNDRSQGLDNSVGRASYAQPVLIWDEDTDELASFTTTFSIQILRDDNQTTGDGMAFFLGHYPSSIPSKDAGGGNLGLFSDGANSTNAVGDSRVVAVEFDTFLNLHYNDTSDNHMGIDINSLISTAYTNTSVPGKNLTSGLVMTCWVSYANSTRSLTADLQIGDASYHVNTSADLRLLLPSTVAIGFSGATGVAVELHRVLAWQFNSTLEYRAPPSPSSPMPAPSPPPNQGGRIIPKVQWKIIGSVIGVVAAAAFGVLLACLWKPLAAKKPADKTVVERPDQQPTSHEAPANVPRPFSYRELAEATDNFALQNKLGEGGYAVVYKGQLKNPTRFVAIKNFKLLRQSADRRKAFEDEIKVISQVRQRHLVDLVGWCIDEEKDIVSLVYELVSQGSLHEHLHKGRSWLPWSRRYQIILNLGCALRYLHGECSDCVLHGDISASNILLDSNYVAKLADFGLARLMDHAIELKTTCNLAGTPGYIDPDFLKTGRRSRESDVYGFGIVLLEIVTGRSPATAVDPTAVSPLLKWVWGIQHCSAVLEAVDPRLRYESTRNQQEQMERVQQVALWCAHTDATQRPSIKQAMMALESWDVVIPPLPLPGFMAGPSILAADDMSCDTSDSVISSAASRT